MNFNNNNTVESQVRNSSILSTTQQMFANNDCHEIRFSDIQNSVHEFPPSYSLWSGDYLGIRRKLLQGLCSANYRGTHTPSYINYLNEGFFNNQGMNFNEEPVSQFGNWIHHQSIHSNHCVLEVKRILEIILFHLFELMIDQELNKALKGFMNSN